MVKVFKKSLFINSHVNKHMTNSFFNLYCYQSIHHLKYLKQLGQYNIQRLTTFSQLQQFCTLSNVYCRALHNEIQYKCSNNKINCLALSGIHTSLFPIYVCLNLFQISVFSYGQILTNFVSLMVENKTTALEYHFPVRCHCVSRGYKLLIQEHYITHVGCLVNIKGDYTAY